MNIDLDDIVVGPLNGEAKKILIFLHGYGANNSLFSTLAEDLSLILPDAVIHVPNGFEECFAGSGGRQWFDLSGWGVAEWKAPCAGAVDKLNIYMDNLFVKYKLQEKDVILAGFSQGAMLSLQCGLERGVGAIVSFAGTLIDSSVLDRKDSVPKVLLVHGDVDAVVPVPAAYEIKDLFKAHGFDLTLKIIPRLEHYIDTRALDEAKAFLKTVV